MTTDAVTVPTGLPLPEEIAALVGDLIGRGTTASVASGEGEVAAVAVAVYEKSDNNQAYFAVLADLSFAAYPGAALTMIPPGGARDVVAEGALTPMLEENAYEVFNVLSRVFNGPGRPHIKLRGVYPPASCPPDSWKLTRSPELAYCVELSVDGYGSGRAQIAALPFNQRF